MTIRLLLLLAAAAVEAIPLALAAAVLATLGLNHGAIDISALPLVATVALAYGLTRLLLRRRVGQRTGRVVLAAGALVVTPLYLGPGPLNPANGLHDPTPVLIPALAALLFAWSRGVVLAREELDFDSIYGAFRRGLIVLFAGLVIGLGTPLTAQIGWGRVLLFFLAGLCALSLARVDEERRRGAGQEGPPPVRGEWVLTLLAVTGGVGLIGVALTSLVAPAAARLSLAPLGRVADLLQWLLTPLFLLLGTLIDPLVRWLQSLRRHQPAIHQPPAHGKQPQLPLAHVSPHEALELGHTALVVIVLVAACVALWLAFARRQHRGDASDGVEERESLWSWRAFLAGLRAALRRLWSRLLGRRGEAMPVAASGVEAGGSGSIREVYRRLLRRAAALGLPRHGAETPHEYLARLRSALPDGEKDAALLTGLYAHARYGPGEPDRYEVATANEVWARLEPALRRQDGDVARS